MSFGETNCSFTIRNCMRGGCYMIWDHSLSLRNDLDLSALQRFEDLTVRVFLLAMTIQHTHTHEISVQHLGEAVPQC